MKFRAKRCGKCQDVVFGVGAPANVRGKDGYAAFGITRMFGVIVGRLAASVELSMTLIPQTPLRVPIPGVFVHPFRLNAYTHSGVIGHLREAGF
jgi:hypothetical protein